MICTSAGAETQTIHRMDDRVDGNVSSSPKLPPYVSQGIVKTQLHHSKCRASGWGRNLEQSLAVFLLVLSAPLLLLIALVVRLTSRGPIFYSQTRLGLAGRRFQIHKFRSMIVDAEKGTGAAWCSRRDSRVTFIGGILRFLHFDELPQLWNIARGDMSFVGPRPERPEFVVLLEEQIPRYWDRLDVLPGVTGLAQINLDPDDSIASVKRKFELDLEYAYSASAWFDFWIMLATILKMGGIPKEFVTRIFGLRRIPLVVVGRSIDIASNVPVTAESIRNRDESWSHADNGVEVNTVA